MSVTQVNFDPTIWSAAGIAPPGFDTNGQDVFGIWLDKDGLHFWAFEYFGAGFAKVAFDGTIIYQGALFNTPGSSHFLTGREDGTALWAQDGGTPNHYFSLSPVVFVSQNLYKTHEGNSGNVNDIFNGRMIIDATLNLTVAAGITYSQIIEDFKVIQSGGVNYICIMSSGKLYVVNADTMTYVGKYIGSGTAWAVIGDATGNIWALFASGVTTTLAKWVPSNGATGGTLNSVTTTNFTLAQLGNVGSAMEFMTYDPVANNVILGNDIQWSGDLVTVNLNSLTAVTTALDNFTRFYAGTFDCPESCMDLGVQSAQLAVGGDVLNTAGNMWSSAQLGGVMNVLDPSTLAVTSTVNLTTLINAASPATPVLAQSINNRARANISAVSEDVSNNLTITGPNNFTAGMSVHFFSLVGASYLNGHTVTVVSATGTSWTAVDPTAHGVYSGVENPATAAAQGSAPSCLLPNANLLYVPVHNCVVVTYEFSGSPVYIVTLAAPVAAPTVFAQVVPSGITVGGSATLSWAATNVTTVTIDHGIGTQPATGSITVSPSITTFYTVTATNVTGTATAIAELQVFSNEAFFNLQKIILTLKQDRIPVRGKNGR